jgi:hypothetical protein
MVERRPVCSTPHKGVPDLTEDRAIIACQSNFCASKLNSDRKIYLRSYQ